MVHGLLVPRDSHAARGRVLCGGAHFTLPFPAAAPFTPLRARSVLHLQWTGATCTRGFERSGPGAPPERGAVGGARDPADAAPGRNGPLGRPKFREDFLIQVERRASCSCNMARSGNPPIHERKR